MLKIRNFAGSHEVASTDVLGFDEGPPSVGAGLTIRVLTAVRPIPIDVYADSFPSRPAKVERRERRRRELVLWLEGDGS